MKMNLIKRIGCLGAVAAMLLAAPQGQALTLNFGSIVGAKVEFTGNGNTFTFLPAPSGGDQFNITGSDGVLLSSLGALGNMSGTFTIGLITTLVGGTQIAPVTGSGTLTIHDGSGFDLTAGLVWGDISTSGTGTGGAINVSGILNLSTITYAGTKADFLALAGPGVGIEAVSFTFIPGKSLTVLTADGTTIETSFSGTINTPPGVPDAGSTITLFGAALMSLGLFRFKRVTK